MGPKTISFVNLQFTYWKVQLNLVIPPGGLVSFLETSRNAPGKLTEPDRSAGLVAGLRPTRGFSNPSKSL